MQISTKFLIVCALAAVITPFASRGADTDAQIKAREALRQKMSELNTQPATTSPAPPAAAPAKAPTTSEPAATKPADTVKTAPPPTPQPAAAPAAATAPAAAATTTEPTPAPAPVQATQKPKPAPTASGQVTASRPDSERIAKAREALELKMKELETQGGQPALASQPPASQRTVASQPPAASTPAPVFHTPEINSPSQPSVTANTTSATEPLPTPPPVKKTADAESKKPSKPKPQPESRPMYALPKGPPPPVSAEKVQKLDSLLRQYEADQITPEQYHQERAKILAGQ